LAKNQNHREEKKGPIRGDGLQPTRRGERKRFKGSPGRKDGLGPVAVCKAETKGAKNEGGVSRNTAVRERWGNQIQKKVRLCPMPKTVENTKGAEWSQTSGTRRHRRRRGGGAKGQ